MLKSLIIGGIPLLGPLTGIGRYSLEISKRITKNRELRTFFYYGYISSRLRSSEEPGGLSGQLSLAKRGVASLGKARKYVRHALEWASRWDLRRFDLYWEPNMLLLPGLWEKSRVSAVTIHDFSCLRYPQWHPRDRVEHFEKNFPRTLARADRIITVSQFVRSEGAEHFGLEPEKVEVIPNGVDNKRFRPYPREELEFFRKKRGLPERYILFVGTLEPRKNISLVLEAFQKLPERFRSRYSLVLAGPRGWEDTALRKTIDAMGSSVCCPGYVSPQELACFYNLAEVFVFPSFYEGFGIPPLEAMGCGTPSVVSRSASLPEVCGDAALYVNPENPEELGEALEEILENKTLRQDLRRKGLERARRFSWEQSARAHETLFLSMIQNL